MLALLGRPQLTLLLTAGVERQLTAADLSGSLMTMARWPETRSVALLLAPDAQRCGHPSADLEAERRDLSDLGSAPELTHCPLLDLTPGAFIRWQ